MAGWERIAARAAGSILALASAPPADGAPSLFAATAAGIHRSQDGGDSWTALGLGQLGWSVGVVAPSPAYAQDTVLFVGTATGLYRSRDGGATWGLVLTGCRVLAIAVSPDFPRDRLLFVATDTDGVLRSDDGGTRWASANPGLVDLTVLALALSPGFGADHTGFAATASGLYRTRNGGKAWRAVDLGGAEPAVQCLALSPQFADDSLVLAGTEEDGLLESRDGGATWRTVAPIGRQGVAAVAVAADPRTMAAATLDGVLLSTDGGASWRPVSPPDDGGLGPVFSLLFVDDGHTLLAGRSQRGLARVDPATGRWAPHGVDLRAGLVVALAVSAEPRRPVLWTGSLEAGAEMSPDGGATWRPAVDGLPDSAVLDLAVAADGTVYAATPAGLVARRTPEAPWGAVAAGRTRKVAVAADGAVVLAAQAAGELTLSTDHGASWRRLAGVDGQVVSLAISPLFDSDGTLLVGTSTPAAGAGLDDDLVLWRSTDAGQRWQRILVTRGPGALPVVVTTDGTGGAVLFAGVAGQVLTPLPATEVIDGERRPSWRRTAVGPPDEPPTVTALALSARAGGSGLLAAGTTAGVQLSADGGATFSPWSQGLEPAPVVALAAGPGHLYAVLLGGTLWRRATGGAG